MYSEKVLENARKSIEIAEAILQGKEIESKFGDSWIDCRDPLIGIAAAFIRVKPDPKLVPFDFSDAEFLLGKIVKGKTFDKMGIICSAASTFVSVNCNMTYKDLLQDYTFIDGYPCGKIQ